MINKSTIFAVLTGAAMLANTQEAHAMKRTNALLGKAISSSEIKALHNKFKQDIDNLILSAQLTPQYEQGCIKSFNRKEKEYTAAINEALEDLEFGEDSRDRRRSMWTTAAITSSLTNFLASQASTGSLILSAICTGFALKHTATELHRLHKIGSLLKGRKDVAEDIMSKINDLEKTSVKTQVKSWRSLSTEQVDEKQ
jgi:hypothetical protein